MAKVVEITGNPDCGACQMTLKDLGERKKSKKDLKVKFVNVNSKAGQKNMGTANAKGIPLILVCDTTEKTCKRTVGYNKEKLDKLIGS